jgi:hypothetical protein
VFQPTWSEWKCVQTTTSTASGEKPAAAKSARNGPLSRFHAGTTRCLSLPTHVSTTIVLPRDSTTNMWIDAISRPSSVA